MSIIAYVMYSTLVRSSSTFINIYEESKSESAVR